MPYEYTHNPQKPAIINRSGIEPHYQCECGEIIYLSGYELVVWNTLSKVGTNDFEKGLELSAEKILDYATQYKENYEDLFYGGHPAKGKRQFSTPMRSLRKVLTNVIRREGSE